MHADERAEPPVPAERACGLGWAFALALLVPLASYAWLGGRHLNPSDEGFLWYGVRALGAGEVPMRDFQAYDPARYAWCVALGELFGDGIRGVRASIAAFQALGLSCALLVARRFARGAPALAFVALLLTLWAFPRHKLFESAAGAMAAWSAVRLVERPSARRHLAAGVFVGLAGCLGRNLGLYAGLGTLALVALLAWKGREPGRARRLGACALGVVLGYLPMLAMLALVPGFARAFADCLRLVLEHGVNIERPWPWPWRVETAGLSARSAAREWANAAAFLLPVLALPPLLWSALRSSAERLRERAACLAPAVVALPFLHHASVNSGAWHLAQCAQPLLLALLGAPLLAGARRGLVRAAAWGGLALVSVPFALTCNPELSQTLGQPSVEARLGGETLRLQPLHAELLGGIERALARTGDDPVFVAPNLPASYCLAGKRSPSWWLFFFWAASRADQEALLRELDGEPQPAESGGAIARRAPGARAEWALVLESPRAVQDKRFSETHPLVWRRFQREWERVATPELSPDFVLFRRPAADSLRAGGR